MVCKPCAWWTCKACAAKCTSWTQYDVFCEAGHRSFAVFHCSSQTALLLLYAKQVFHKDCVCVAQEADSEDQWRTMRNMSGCHSERAFCGGPYRHPDCSILSGCHGACRITTFLQDCSKCRVWCCEKCMLKKAIQVPLFEACVALFHFTLRATHQDCLGGLRPRLANSLHNEALCSESFDHWQCFRRRQPCASRFILLQSRTETPRIMYRISR